MARLSKRIRCQRQKIAGAGKVLDLPAAVRLLKSLEAGLPANVKPCRFDQTVALAVRLGVDPKQADQRVRGSVVLPHGVGKPKRVLVFCQGDNVALAQQAGADHVGGKELADKIKEGWLEFDVAIATPDMMGVVAPLGKVLGPRGLMPSPRAGTVTQDVATAVKEYKAGKVEFRCDDGANVHCVVGKLSFSEQQLVENIEALLKYLRSVKPAAAKGQYIRHVALAATMTPGITIAI
ncbi:MAG: 50S ribosomal protein L1 [Planctomycetaceae bacterium]|nr:MAG: 50S ribosomal protein L1 [Planctomycetaceae bacterium]